MSRRTTIFSLRSSMLLLSCSAALTSSAMGAEKIDKELALHSFVKQHLTEQFFSEGSAIGDYNGDGIGDVATGPYWYAGPDYAKKHIIYPPKPFDPKSYSDDFMSFTHDFNGDGRDDVLVIGWPGKEAIWFENSGNDQPWVKHVVFDVVDNESPCFADVTGDGKPELLCTTGGFVGYATVDWLNPTKPWTFHKISAKGEWQRYSHGLGSGDVNKDGRIDLLTKEAWWEQPASLSGDPLWIKHAVDFGRGGAQMLVYDADGDGRNDVITSLHAHEWGLAWFQQQADGSFKRNSIIGEKETDSPYGVKLSQMHALALADIDGDGLNDIVTGKRYWAHGPGGDPEPAAPAVLYWFQLTRSDTGVTYVPHQIDNNSGVGTQVTVGDLNGDKRPDIVVGNKKGTFVFTNTAKMVDAKTWQAAQPKPVR